MGRMKPRVPSLVPWLRQEMQSLLAVQSSTRRWHMPVAAALAIGLPVLIAAAAERLSLGLVASVGGLSFLYVRDDLPLGQRMALVMGVAFGLAGCYALGVMTQALAAFTVPLLTLIAVLVTMACRAYRVRPPASLFFVMAAAIGAYTPVPLEQMPQMVGLVFLGGLLACGIAFAYSVLVLNRWPAERAPSPAAAPGFDELVVEPVLIGAMVGLSLALAELLQMPRPYWVPVSCMAVIQGSTLRAVWNRHLQRVAGTALGLVVTAGLLMLPLTPWTVALMLMLLSLTVELLIVRHYGLATVFITPMTILLAEAAVLGAQSPHAALMQARFLDTVLGCLVGLLGGVLLHHKGLRGALARSLKGLRPGRGVEQGPPQD